MQRSTTSINLLIQKRAHDSRTNNTKPWGEVRHHAGRLVSYYEAVDVLIMATYFWPELFQDFQVKYVPSSRTHPNPLKPTTPSPVEVVVGQMVSRDEKEMYVRLAEALPQKKQLDDLIKTRWMSANLEPYVHAEMLVLNHLENTDGTRPTLFFNNMPYIGTSKPTCRLCDSYFDYHPGGVEVRGSHGNVYPKWRFPDSPDVGGISDDMACRQRIMKSIADRLLQEILRILRDKTPGTRAHDSNTASSRVPRQGNNSVQVPGEVPMEENLLALQIGDASSSRGGWSDVEEEMDAVGQSNPTEGARLETTAAMGYR